MLAVTAVVLLLAADRPGDRSKKQLDRLQGTWRLASVEGSEGEVLSADPVRGLYLLIVRGNEVEIVEGGDRQVGVSVDLPSGFITGWGEDLYFKISKDTLILYRSQPRIYRPSLFKSLFGSRTLVFHRQRSASARRASAKEAMKELRGTWDLVYDGSEEMGHLTREGTITDGRTQYVFKDRELTLFSDGVPFDRYHVKVDGQSEPKAIALGQYANHPSLGHYQLAGDVLKIYLTRSFPFGRLEEDRVLILRRLNP
jgi:hypothetical protein